MLKNKAKNTVYHRGGKNKDQKAIVISGNVYSGIKKVLSEIKQCNNKGVHLLGRNSHPRSIALNNRV